MFDIVSYILGKKAAESSAGLTTKSVTFNGTYLAQDDSASGYSKVSVNVQNGASLTQVQNSYGTELRITSAEGSTPSATRHTLYFEYEDESTETVYIYYDDALISSAITATTPTTRGGKTVTSAQLDGTEWYSYTPTPDPTPSGDWETEFDSTITSTVSQTSGKYVARIEELQDLWFTLDDTWRVTYDGVQYICVVGTTGNGVLSLGNSSLIDTDNGTNEPFLMYNVGGGSMICITRSSGEHTLKLEQSV